MLTGIQGVVKQVLEVQVMQLQGVAVQQGGAADEGSGDSTEQEQGPASKRRALM